MAKSKKNKVEITIAEEREYFCYYFDPKLPAREVVNELISHGNFDDAKVIDDDTVEFTGGYDEFNADEYNEDYPTIRLKRGEYYIPWCLHPDDHRWGNVNLVLTEEKFNERWKRKD